MDLTLPVRFHYASTTLPLRFCYDPTTTMKIWLRLVYADGDVAATLLRPVRWSYAFVALLYPFYIESEIPIRFYYDIARLLRFYCALAVSATIRVFLTKILNRSGIAVQWNGGLRNKCSFFYNMFIYIVYFKGVKRRNCQIGNFLEGFIFAKLRFMEIRTSQNGEITLSITDIGKSCSSREFLTSQVCLLTIYSRK